MMADATPPTVSVITVVFNDRAGLAATLENVRRQSYPQLEYVVVDGASTDGTRELIEEELQRPDARINRWLSEPDNGLYDAMNKGLRLATGDFVIFMNAADLFYDDDTLQRAMADYAGEDVIYGDSMLVDEAYNELGLRRHKALPRRLTKFSMRLGMVVCHQSLLVRRSLAPSYRTEHPHSADIDWTIRVLAQTQAVRNTGFILSKFQVGGHSTKHRKASWLDRYRILRRHFGLPLTLLAHVEILGRAALRRLGLPV